MNFVHLHKKRNPDPNARIEDSVAHVKKIIQAKMKEFMKRVCADENSVPKSSRQLHLSCLKVSHIFFNSANQFGSDMHLLTTSRKTFTFPFGLNPNPNPNSNLTFLETFNLQRNEINFKGFCSVSSTVEESRGESQIL